MTFLEQLEKRIEGLEPPWRLELKVVISGPINKEIEKSYRWSLERQIAFSWDYGIGDDVYFIFQKR